MNFFCTKNHYDKWVSKMGLDESNIFCLDVNEAMHVARMLFSVTDI